MKAPRPTKPDLALAREGFCAGHSLIGLSTDLGISYDTLKRASSRERWGLARRQASERRAAAFAKAMEEADQTHVRGVLGRQMERLQAVLSDVERMRELATPVLRDGEPVDDGQGGHLHHAAIRCAKDLLFLVQALQIAHQEQRVILRVPNPAAEKGGQGGQEAQPAIALDPGDARWSGAVADLEAREAAEREAASEAE